MFNSKKLVIFFIWYFFIKQLYAQPYSQNLPVFHGNKQLDFPWIGGLDNPRFQNIDLNHDGFKDLVILDAQDNQLLTFLHTGIQDSIKFIFAPEYISFFPSFIYHWILLVDFDHDGEEDIFTSTENSSNVLVYRNTRKETGTLGFELIYEPLQAEISPGTFGPLSILDIPAITDVDGDVDVDILAWGPSGNRVELYRNVSNSLKNLDFRIRSFCWGRFFDDSDSILKVQLQKPCNFDQKTLHIGGTILALSLNGDSLIDALISDQGTNNVVALFNGGSKTIANMVSQDTFFPSDNISLELPHYPAIFQVDVNGDGKKDLLFSPNGNDMPSNNLYFMNHSDAGWLYLNHGSYILPNFQLYQKNFFYENIIDGGSNSVPVLFDEDNDGDLDFLLLTNNQYVFHNHSSRSQKEWRYYQNNGTNSQPIFELKTTNFKHWNEWELLDTLQNISIAVVDIDKDGDTDIFLGHKAGKILFLENQYLDTSNYELKSLNYANIQVQANSSPHFADIDGDEDFDLIVGNSSGNLLFCENIGNPWNPQWASSINFWGNIHVADEFNPIVANAKPFWYDYDKNGTPNLLIGNASGYIKVYEYLGNHQFQFLGNLFDKRITSQAAPFITSFQTDSIYFFVGSKKGGVYLFKAEKGWVNRKKNIENFWKIYPNPFENFFCMQSYSKEKNHWEIWDLLGNKIDEGIFWDNFCYEKPLKNQLYILKIQNDDFQQTFKLMKLKH
jgi:hypothetical protein